MCVGCVLLIFSLCSKLQVPYDTGTHRLLSDGGKEPVDRVRSQRCWATIALAFS
jgi:hypothetical protein